MYWTRADHGDGMVFEVGPRLRMGWSKALGGYWIELLDQAGQEVLQRVDHTGDPDLPRGSNDPLSDVEDLLDWVVIWNMHENDDDLVEWGEDAALVAQLEAAKQPKPRRRFWQRGRAAG